MSYCKSPFCVSKIFFSLPFARGILFLRDFRIMFSSTHVTLFFSWALFFAVSSSLLASREGVSLQARVWQQADLRGLPLALATATWMMVTAFPRGASRRLVCPAASGPGPGVLQASAVCSFDEPWWELPLPGSQSFLCVCSGAAPEGYRVPAHEARKPVPSPSPVECSACSDPHPPGCIASLLLSALSFPWRWKYWEEEVPEHSIGRFVKQHTKAERWLTTLLVNTDPGSLPVERRGSTSPVVVS